MTTTRGSDIFMRSFLCHTNSPKKTFRCFRTSRAQHQLKRKGRDSTSIKCGKLSASGPGIAFMTRLIWYRQHPLISWPVLNAGLYNLQKSFHAFYSAAPAAGIYSPAINMPDRQEGRKDGNCLSKSLFLQSGSLF